MKNRTLNEKIVLLIVFLFFALFAITLIYPFIWALFNSLKTNPNYFRDPFGVPKGIYEFKNYLKAFSDLEIANTNLIGMFFNSALLTIGGTFMTIMSSSLTAYVLSKYKFKLRNFIYGVAVFIMIVPIVGALPAYYKLLSDLHFVNNIFGMILTFGGGFGIYFLFLYGFFKSISWEYAEAAFVDGASDYMVFFKIMLPQAKPALVSVGIICAIGIWNDYFTPFMFLDQFPTVSLGIYQFETLMIYQSNYPVYFAAILLSSIPMIVIYSLFQKTILENTVAGGLKG